MNLIARREFFIMTDEEAFDFNLDCLIDLGAS